LRPTLFSAAKEVAAEPFGVVGAINTSFDDKGVAKGDNVSVDVAPTRAAADFTPGALPRPATTRPAKIDVTITKSRKVFLAFDRRAAALACERHDQSGLGQAARQAGHAYPAQRSRSRRRDRRQGRRVPRVRHRRHHAVCVRSDRADQRAQDPVDNGAPKADLQMVFDTNAGLNLRNLGVLQNAYQAGSDAERRTGEFLPQMGFRLSESAGIGLHTKGTGASYTTSARASPSARPRFR
jgi:hypothetical protein